MFYDIAYFDVDKALTKLLGYKRIYCIGKDISLNEEGDYIIADAQALHKFKLSNIIGVRVSKVDKALFQKIKENDKPIIIDISNLLSKGDFIREYNTSRNILRNAIKMGLRVSLASFAKDEEHLLSALQMLEIAKFLGAGEERAKEMLGNSYDIEKKE
ncbi:MAG: hypothetical protein RXO35_00425 [Candidatus Micrarchaeota archaeon]